MLAVAPGSLAIALCLDARPIKRCLIDNRRDGDWYPLSPISFALSDRVVDLNLLHLFVVPSTNVGFVR
jgi:hypothetical protein